MQGDSIGVYVAIVNLSANPLAVVFPTTQIYDFALLDDHGKEYWRWSTGQKFATLVQTITVPGSASGGFQVVGIDALNIPLPTPLPAYVTLVGELTSSNFPFTGMLRILVSR
jgi:hypothetical protein